MDLQDNYVAEILTQDQVAASSGSYSATATIAYTSTTAGLVGGYGLPGVPWSGMLGTLCAERMRCGGTGMLRMSYA